MSFSSDSIVVEDDDYSSGTKSIASCTQNKKQRRPVVQTTYNTGPTMVTKQSRFGYIDLGAWKGYGYIVSKKNFKDSQFDMHRKWLTIEPRDSSLFFGGKPKHGNKSSSTTKQESSQQDTQEEKDDDSSSYPLYFEDAYHFVVPREYGYARWGAPAQDESTLGEDMQSFTFQGKPTGLYKEDPPQISSINTVLEQWNCKDLISCGQHAQQQQQQQQHAQQIQSKMMTRYWEPIESCTNHGKKNKTATVRPTGSKDAFARTRSCIMSVYCGGGKTFMSLFLAHRMKRKTLVFLHRDNLMDGWMEDIETFMPEARVGIIKGSKCEYKDKDIVLAMIQTVVKKDIPRHVFESFGLCIVDECHHICARSFCRVMQKICCRYVLGLSATPYRRDRLDHVLNWLLGPIVVHIEREVSHAQVTMIRYSHPKQYEIKYGDKIQYAAMITRVCQEEARNRFIAQILVDTWMYPQPRPARRKILVLSERGRELHIDALNRIILETFCARYKTLYPDRTLTVYRDGDDVESKDQATESSSKQQKKKKKSTKHGNIKQGFMYNDQVIFSVGILVGGMKNRADRDIAKTCDVILSNFQTVEEGFNCPRLDTLINTVIFRGDMRQTVGRIERPHSEKNLPKIIEIMDDYSFFANTGAGHMQWYRSRGFQVQEIMFRSTSPSNKEM